MDIKNIVKNNTARFSFYRAGFYYSDVPYLKQGLLIDNA